MTTPRRQRVTIKARRELPPKPKPSLRKLVDKQAEMPIELTSLEPPPAPELPQVDQQAANANDLVRVPILDQPVLTPNEVGTLLRVSPRTVMKLVQDGDLPAMRMEQQTRVLRIDLLRFMRALRDKQ